MNLKQLLIVLMIGSSIYAMDDASKIPGHTHRNIRSHGYYDGFLGQDPQQLYGFVGYRVMTAAAPAPTPAPTPSTSDEETNIVYY